MVVGSESVCARLANAHTGSAERDSSGTIEVKPGNVVTGSIEHLKPSLLFKSPVSVIALALPFIASNTGGGYNHKPL